jgi:hypothetical protein
MLRNSRLKILTLWLKFTVLFNIGAPGSCTLNISTHHRPWHGDSSMAGLVCKRRRNHPPRLCGKSLRRPRAAVGQCWAHTPERVGGAEQLTFGRRQLATLLPCVRKAIVSMFTAAAVPAQAHPRHSAPDPRGASPRLLGHASGAYHACAVYLCPCDVCGFSPCPFSPSAPPARLRRCQCPRQAPAVDYKRPCPVHVPAIPRVRGVCASGSHPFSCPAHVCCWKESQQSAAEADAALTAPLLLRIVCHLAREHPCERALAASACACQHLLPAALAPALHPAQVILPAQSHSPRQPHHRWVETPACAGNVSCALCHCLQHAQCHWCVRETLHPEASRHASYTASRHSAAALVSACSAALCRPQGWCTCEMHVWCGRPG